MKRGNFLSRLLDGLPALRARSLAVKARLFGPCGELIVSGDKIIFPTGDEIDLRTIRPELRQKALAEIRECWANLPKP
jgi:hypothetical protein